MKKAIRITVSILAWIMLILALIVTLIVFSAEKNNGVSNVFGYMPMTVESDSMSPTFKKGDLIIVKEVDDVNSLEVDDVITFWTIIDGRRVKNTHRIVEIKDTDGVKSYITRGDNNGVDDDLPANTGDIIGKWNKTKLSGAGKALDFLKTKKGFFICIIIPMAIFFLFELYKFIATLIEIRKPETEKLDEEEIKRRAIEEYIAEQNKNGGAAPAAEAEKAAETVKEAIENTEKTVEEVKETVEEKIEDKAETTAETAAEVTEKAEESLSAAEEIKETAEDIQAVNNDQEK